MKASFLVLAGDAATPSSALCERMQAEGMHLASSAAGVMILGRQASLVQQLGPNVLIIGKTWHRDGRAVPTADRSAGLSGTELAQMVIGSAWGDYLAVIQARDGIFVMSDPSGAGRAHIANIAGGCVVSDGISPGMMRLLDVVPRVDREALAGCLVHPAASMSARLLDDVVPMTPGRLYSGTTGREVGRIWSPARASLPHERPGTVLRTAVDHALDCMGGVGPLVQLSGGLDSAIVFGSIAAAGRDPNGFTYDGGDGDVSELAYAREVADRAGRPLHASAPGAMLDYSYLRDEPQIATPYLYGLDTGFEDSAARVKAMVGADRMLTGQGGDAVFLRSFSAAVAVDRRRAMGLRGLSPARLLDDAWRTKRTIWHHLLPAIRDYLPDSRQTPDLLAPHLLGRTYRDTFKLLPHPWNGDAADLPPGKRSHVALIANCQLFHAPRPGDREAPLHPLLAQPVLEAVLELPSWQLVDGPVERALARSTFADRLPASVAARTIKGEASAHFSRAAVANLPFLRSFLLDGALASSGLLDVDALANLLTEEQLFHSLDYRSLVVQASFEAWFRAWS